MNYILHKNDLPADIAFGDTLAIDTEFMGLDPWRDRLCLLQIYDGREGSKVHIVQFEKDRYDAPVLKKIMSDPAYKKIFYYARGDMRWISRYLGVLLRNVYCTKIASRIARTYTQSHELEDELRAMLDIRLSKEQQCTYWGAETLDPEQLEYACNDVLHLHALRTALDRHLAQEGRTHVAEDLFLCLPAIVQADMAGWYNLDHFSYFMDKK